MMRKRSSFASSSSSGSGKGQFKGMNGPEREKGNKFCRRCRRLRDPVSRVPCPVPWVALLLLLLSLLHTLPWFYLLLNLSDIMDSNFDI